MKPVKKIYHATWRPGKFLLSITDDADVIMTYRHGVYWAENIVIQVTAAIGKARASA